MMDFYQQTGKIALGTRLRRLSEKLMEDASKGYELYNVGLDPKWFLVSETQHNVWKAVEDVEFLLDEKSFFSRARDTRKTPEQQQLEIIDYGPEFRDDFKQLNYAWIEHYFTIEESDRKYLDHPDEKIIQPGGHILMARYGDNIVGTCALVKMNDTRYELANMAVTIDMRGRGSGWLLGQSAIDKARKLGAKTLYIESNTALTPAIKLYQQLSMAYFAKCF